MLETVLLVNIFLNKSFEDFIYNQDSLMNRKN